jgi:lipid II:glycine glycyltransferase (peptidoglycan interpeptide bridge formation enzyme)
LQLDLNAFDSQPIEVPNLSSIVNTTKRQEYIIDLRQLPDFRKKEGLSSNHRRNIKKAERAGLTYHIRNDFEACKDHSRLMSHSMHRRKSRGQSVHYKGSPQKWFTYVQCKAGFIIQAKHDNDWVSSHLIFRSSHQAYYASGGTSPSGMQLGAAHYLMWKAIQYLSSKGVSTLNLGGASETDTPGLARFKAGFNAKPIELPHRSYITGSLWRYRIVRAVHRLKLGLRTLGKDQLKR